MNLHQKLFGLNLMAPAGESDGGGDRGDDYVSTVAVETEDAGAAAAAQQDEDDLKLATGGDDEGKDEPARDAAGKFTKKEADDEPKIPKSRFDAQIAKERERAQAAERALQDLQKQQQQVSRTVDVNKLIARVSELRDEAWQASLDGDKAAMKTLTDEADRLNRQIALEGASHMTAAAKEEAREEIRWDLTVDNLYAQYPQLDEDSAEFDQEFTDDIIDKMNGYVSRERLPRSAALLKAAKYVAAQRARAVEPVQEVQEGATLRTVPKVDGRKEAAVKKNLAAAAAQPGSTKAVGADSDRHGQNAPTPAAADMTYEEFSALPESTKAKMRGDLV